jgi:hypothetical protein
MKNSILSKVFNSDGSLRWSFAATKYAQKYFTPDELKLLESSFGDTLLEKYWCLKHDITEKPKCPVCGASLKFRSFRDGGYQACCSSPSALKHKDKRMRPKKHETVNAHTPEGPRARYTRYSYDGIGFDSSWELAFWIYHKDHYSAITRNMTKRASFIYEGKKRWVVPDFILEGRIVEIKGDHLARAFTPELWAAKEKALKSMGATILYHADVKIYLDYVRQKYGPKHLQSFKKKSRTDFKRGIIEVESPGDAFKHRNDNVRFHYACKSCSADVYATYHVLTHFADMLCKKCRLKIERAAGSNQQLS